MVDSVSPSPLVERYSEKYSDDPRTDLLALIGKDVRTILEIGCGTGATGEALNPEKTPYESCSDRGVGPTALSSSSTESRTDSKTSRGMPVSQPPMLTVMESRKPLTPMAKKGGKTFSTPVWPTGHTNSAPRKRGAIS